MLKIERSVQILLVCIFVAMLGLGIMSPILPLYASDLGANLVQIGLLSSAWSISRLIFTAPAGRYSDRGSRKKVIMAGLLVYAVVSFLYVLAWDFTSLVSIRFLHGLGSAMTMPIAMAYGAALAPQGREGRYMGLMTSSMFAGMGLGPYLGGTLTDVFGFKSAAFYAMGGLSAISLVLVTVFLPDERAESGRGDAPSPSFRKVLSIRILRAAFIYRVVGALGRGSVMGFLSMYLSNPMAEGGLGISYSMVGFILSVSQLASAFLQGPFGELADRYDKIRLILLGGVLGAVGLALIPLAHNTWEALAAQLVFTVGGALGMPALSAIVAIEGREIGMGTTMSVLQSSMSVGMIAGPLLSGILGDLFGLKVIFFIGSTIYLLGTAAFLVIQRH
ncbi:MAG: MFS transporter [Candidatus Bathyarchaeota archaeon]|nr:MAG: MFS transporter [Candidatus Bathyarchaeota archaeon]